MAAYHRVYDSRHLQADCQEPGSAPEPYARQSSMGYLYFLPIHPTMFALRFTGPRNETPEEGVNAPRRDTNGLWYVQSRDSLVVHQSSERSLRVTRQREAPRRRWSVARLLSLQERSRWTAVRRTTAAVITTAVTRQPGPSVRVTTASDCCPTRSPAKVQ